MTVQSEYALAGSDLLLEWASEMSAGSWAQWCEACRTLGLEPTLQMLDLAALGHVEVNWSTNRFSCPPPTAAFLRRSSGCLFLTGARPRGLLHELQELEVERDDLGFYMHEPYSHQRGPQTVLIEVDLDDAQELCEASGLDWSFDPAGHIAGLLPIATLDEVASRADWPPRDDVPRQRFNPDKLRFETYRGYGDNGLWSYDGYRRSEAWLFDGQSWWKFPTREFAPYLSFPSYTFLRYRQTMCQLQVPMLTPLPPLQARAATLASGRLPHRFGAKGAPAWCYENISPELALRIADSLATPLEMLP